MEKQLERLCRNYGLGVLRKAPQPVTGGLMHKMYHVCTAQGDYAIKVLNPNIMQRPEAFQNMVNAELAAEKLNDTIPLIVSKRFDGKHILTFEGNYYIVFDWIEGKSIFIPEITNEHCKQIGKLLGKIHAADIRVSDMEQKENFRGVYDWKRLCMWDYRTAGNQETTAVAGFRGMRCRLMEQDVECRCILKENLEALLQWDQNVVRNWPEVMKRQVISHRDLDPKNVMWQGDQPLVIDWEAAGYVNPAQELLEVINYWTVDENGNYSKEKFETIMQAYTEHVDVSDVDWEAILNFGFDGMLGWLEYNVKRALGMETKNVSEQQEGLQQVRKTMIELKRYEAQKEQLQNWICEFF